MKIYKITLTVLATFLMVIASLSPAFADTHPFIIEKYGQFGSDNGDFFGPYAVEIVNDKYFVTDHNNDRIQVFDLDWNYLTQFGGSGTGNGQLDGPYDIAYNGTYLFVSELTNDRISVFDQAGGFIDTFGVPGTAGGEFDIPTTIEFHNDRIYIADFVNNRVQIWNESNLVYLTQVTSNINSPEGLFITEDYMFVTDTAGPEIDVFTMETTNPSYLYSIGTGVDTPGEMGYPGAIEVIDEYLLISDYGGKIVIYDLAGNFVKNIQANLDGPFKFKVKDNSIIIPEAGDHEITVLRLTANPSNVVARSSGTNVQISWNINPEEGMMAPERFNIYRDDGTGEEFIGQSLGQSFVDVTSVQNTSYTYAVEAISGLSTSDRITSNSITPGSSQIGDTVTVTETITEDESSSNPLPVDLLPFMMVLMVIPLLRRWLK